MISFEKFRWKSKSSPKSSNLFSDCNYFDNYYARGHGFEWFFSFISLDSFHFHTHSHHFIVQKVSLLISENVSLGLYKMRTISFFFIFLLPYYFFSSISVPLQILLSLADKLRLTICLSSLGSISLWHSLPFTLSLTILFLSFSLFTKLTTPSLDQLPYWSVCFGRKPRIIVSLEEKLQQVNFSRRFTKYRILLLRNEDDILFASYSILNSMFSFIKIT